jgi:hypothetical protein
MPQQVYAGIDKDYCGGMTRIGNMIRDAWLFGILPETEKCESWTNSQLQVIYEQVNREWDKYGCLVSNLPDDLRERHREINDRAIEKARALGWDPTPDVNDD